MKVYGKVNGTEVSFDLVDGKYTATVPSSGELSYVLELWAEDEAGNVGHMTSILVAYDYDKLCFTFSILDISAGWTFDDVKSVFSCAELACSFSAEKVNADFLMNEIETNFGSKVL